MTTTISLRAASSDGLSEYIVTFDRREDQKSLACTCPAGEIGRTCRHRLAFLRGDEKMLFDGSQRTELRRALDWVRASPFATLLRELDDAERAQADAKRAITKIRRQIESAMKQGV